MKTSGSSFESILEEVLKQKQLLEILQAENETLRQQLSELRAGRGVFLDILGLRIPLEDNSDVSSFAAVSNGVVNEDTTPTPATILTAQADPSLQETSVIASEVLLEMLKPPTGVSMQETTAIASEVLPSSTPETPFPSDDFLVEEVSENDTLFPVPTSATFLEEALIDEFSSATTRQMGVWSGPITNHPTLDEDEKATLRRELMGSFLLE